MAGDRCQHVGHIAHDGRAVCGHRKDQADPRDAGTACLTLACQGIARVRGHPLLAAHDLAQNFCKPVFRRLRRT